MARRVIVQKRRKIKHPFFWISLILIIENILVFSGGCAVCHFIVKKNVANNQVIVDESQASPAPMQTQENTQTPEDIENEKVNALISEMTLSDKVYQMMFVTPEKIVNIGTAIAAGEATKEALQKHPVGGLVYFAKNFESREQTTEMIANSQSYSKIPLFISVDEEGGRVARLGENAAMGTTKQPAMQEIGATQDPQRAYEVGKTLATELKQFGFNTDFAPVADVLINTNNTEIGDRAFGTDAALVSSMVGSAVKGIQENGLSATLKHFPGHGSTQVDSHTGYSASARTIEELRQVEFLPFKAGIEAGVDFVMISHATFENVVTEKVPASLSKEVITDLLLNELQFKGVVITDSFSMGAITEEFSIKEAAVRAVNAGVDMILMPSDVTATHTAIVDAVNAGEISQERIDQSVRKILTLKVKKQMIK